MSTLSSSPASLTPDFGKVYIEIKYSFIFISMFFFKFDILTVCKLQYIYLTVLNLNFGIKNDIAIRDNCHL